MHTRKFMFFVLVICLSILSLAITGQPVNANQVGAEGPALKHTLAISGTGIYIVQLQEASLAMYRGGIAKLPATSPEVTGARRLDTRTPASQNYLKYLDKKQGELLDSMAHAYRHPIEVVYQYKNVLNAVAVRLSHSEALQAFNLPGVRSVYSDRIAQLDTDVGPTLIGAPHIWTGDTPGDVTTKGEGIIIGLIDSGINHAHPSFADIGGDGYDHTNPYGAGNYLGYCITDPGFCNDKLIGAYDLVDSGGPEDEAGHGSHTASTSAGNHVVAEISDGTGGTFNVNLSGVAPHANIIAYRVCDDDGGCWSNATVAAVDHAIEDMVDVLNYSISGSDDPWADPTDLAFLEAFTAGIFVSASAGNAGPDPSTVAKTGPWNAAVAASTHNRILAHPVDIITDDTGDTDLIGLGALEGNGPPLTADLTAPIIYAGDVDPANYEGCTPWVGTPFAGAIGFVSRGVCSFAIKVDNLAAAGAVGALVYNQLGGPPIYMGGLETTTIPAMMISNQDGLSAVALIGGSKPASVTLHIEQAFAYNNSWGDILADFSSRGPSQWELLKPDYTAPGVNILAAVAALAGDPIQYELYSGTSMAAPHGSGSAALLIALHPDWSPAEVKSAISTTTDPNLLKEDATTPATPFDSGSGRIDLAAAAFAGIVLDETSANYIAANPYLGGEPNTLNQPSMVDYSCIGLCSWTRTVKSTLTVSQDWAISFDTPTDLVLSANPMNFTLGPGETQTIVITADMSAGVPDVYYFGNMILTPEGSTEVSISHLPVVTRLGVSNLPKELDILTDELAGSVNLADMQASVDITKLVVDVAGMVKGTPHDLLLNQDPTNTDPFDDLNQVFWTTITVPNHALRLVAEIVQSEALDIDLFLGTGDTPSLDTLVSYSASGIWAEYVNVDNPAKGTWWVLIQNWQGSADQPDAIRVITAIVEDADAGNLTVTGPTTVPALQMFDLQVNWDELSMLPGEFWYGQFSLGSANNLAGNLGYTNVDLVFVTFYRNWFPMLLGSD